MKHIIQGIITLIPSFNNEKVSSDLFVKSTQTAIEHTPSYAMIITQDNSRVQQVLSGMVYSRLNLTAHNLGISIQPTSQALEEYPEMDTLYSAIHQEYAPHSGTIQMFVRLGLPTKAALPTMRRDVLEIIEMAKH